MNTRGCLRRPAAMPPFGIRRRLMCLLFDAHGVRGWVRALLFMAIWALAIAALFLTIHLVSTAVPELHRRMLVMGQRLKAGGPFTPWFIIVYELMMLGCALFATWAMTWLDGRPFADIGLPRQRSASDLLAGWAVGFGMLGLLVAALLTFGFGRLGPPTLGLEAALGYGLTWGVAALLVGAHEEILFRGYLFTILRERFGFWPGALVMTGAFMIAHGHNVGEDPVGLITVGATSILFCLAIRRTGALWWAIGCHAAWDWAEDYFFGSADSGTHSLDRLLTLLPHGSRFLSGGTDGPEGSLLCLVVLLMAIAALPLLIRRRPAVQGAPSASVPAGEP